MLDEDSSVTIINAKVADEIGAKRSRSRVALRGIGNSEVTIMTNEKINIKIKSGLETFSISIALVISDLALPEQKLSKELGDCCWERARVRVSPY